MMATGFMEMLVLLLVGGAGVNLPVGLPPMPEDPKMAQVAPEDVLAYVSWAGTAEADPKSGNSVERLLAEAQVQELVKRIEQAIVVALGNEARNDPDAAAAIKHGHLLIKQLLTRPTVVYLSKLEIRDVPLVEAGLVVNFGKDAAAAKGALEALETLIAREIGPFEVMPANQGGLRRAPVPEDESPLIAWGFEGDYLLIAIGKDTAARLRGAVTGGKQPAWLADVKKKLPVKRNSSITYLNVPAIVKQFGPMIASQMGHGPQGQQMLDRVLAALGVDKITSLTSVTGFDDKKFVARSLIATTGNPGGIFKLIGEKGLTAADLADVPQDADLALVMKLDAAQVWDEAMKIMAAIDPDMHEEFQEELAEAEQEFLTFRVKEDLIDALGDVWSIYNSPGEGGLVITGLTGVVKLKDAGKAQKVVDRLEAMFNEEWNRGDPNNPRRRRYEIKTVEHAGQKIRYINPIGDDWVVAPAWCVTKDRFVIAPYPQMVKAYLTRTADAAAKSLAETAQVKPLLAGGTGPAMITYMDTPELFKKFYPLAHGFAALICSELQREGIDIDVTALPMMSAILPHLSPDTGIVRRTADGIFSESSMSLPVSNAAGMLPVMMGFMMPMRAHSHPAVRFEEAHAHGDVAAPVRVVEKPVLQTPAAKRSRATAELRQIGVAIFIYDADKGKPAPDLAALKPYLNKELKEDPWGQPYIYYGKTLRPATKEAAKTPFAATSHAIEGKRIVLYGDGHVELIEERAFKKQVEAAKLEYKEPVEIKDDKAGEAIEKGDEKSGTRPLPPTPQPTTPADDKRQGRAQDDAPQGAVQIEIKPIRVQVEIEVREPALK